MKRTYGLARLVALGVVAVSWATVALAQQPPAPRPARLPAPPNPTPVMPGAPGTVPVPLPTVVNGTAPPAPAHMAPVPAEPVAPAPVPAPVPAVPAPAQPAQPTQPAEAAHQTTLVSGQASDAVTDAVGPTGRQEPAVSVEWLGPTDVKVGKARDYAVVVHNACAIPVQQVLVRVRLVGAAGVVATEPKAVADENVLAWEVGTLMPKQEKTLQMRIVAGARGDVAAQAWVTFTGATALKVKVREPKLVVKAAAPEKVLVGDAAQFTITVLNPGDGLAENVKVAAELTEGLEHPRGQKVEFALGNLGAGEARSVQVVCLTKTAGEQACAATAEAEGGMKATDRAACSVIVPRLDVEAHGPKLRYLDRKATFTIKVTNPGDAPAANVTVNDVLPAGFKFVSADGGGQHDFATRTVSWFLGEVGPGQTREVNVEVVCAAPGEFTQKVAAQASRGIKVEGEAQTRVEGLSAVQVEMVDLEDPVELNGETTYEIRITNTGSKTETDLKLVCTLPADKEQFKTATGPSAYKAEGGEVVFDPLPKLAPGANAVYRVTVKCTAAGTAHFKCRLTSAVLTEPVTKEEATRIYAD